MQASEVAVLILAAGAGSRFAAAASGDTSAERQEPPTKLLAPLHGRPILEHVLDRMSHFGAAATIAVIGTGPAARELESRIGWHGVRRVRNPHAAQGLAGSVRIGLDALATSLDASVRAALIILGDQPRVSVEVMRRLLDAAAVSPGSPIVAPRYPAGGGSNPLLIRRDAWSLSAALEGDRGFGPLLAARPELVRFVDVPGSNPDVDTPADLADLADLADMADMADLRDPADGADLSRA